MNTVCFCPRALLFDPGTRPVAREFHWLDLADDYVILVTAFIDDEDRDAFLALPGVEPWPDLDLEPNAPLLPAQAARLSGAPGLANKTPLAGRPAIAALEDLRRAGWPMARRRF
jgi:hypothetical protein